MKKIVYFAKVKFKRNDYETDIVCLRHIALLAD